MTALKDNIDHYMEIKGIKKYSKLLFTIGRELGLKVDDAYVFATKEKANFSKMLKGERPLKYEFIIPLEKIFGVSLARMLEENAYRLPMEKENIPFDKGFRYYAYVDDTELYVKEFDNVLDKDGKPVICNPDEFRKTFPDYVAEYGSVNGVRYLYNNYGITVKWSDNQFLFNNKRGEMWIHPENVMLFCRVVASMEDTQLFYSIYDSYHLFYSNGSYVAPICIYNLSEYLELIMDNEALFNELFVVKEHKQPLGVKTQKKYGKEYITRYSPNPILNNCLKYALGHLDKYRKQAIRILEFGRENNIRIVDGYNVQDCYLGSFLGLVRNKKDEEFRGFAIVACGNYDDPKIQSLISDLPSFNDIWNYVENFYSEDII